MEPEDIEELMDRIDSVVAAADEIDDFREFSLFVMGLISGGVVSLALKVGVSPNDAAIIAQQTIQYARASIDANKAERKRIRESN